MKKLITICLVMLMMLTSVPVYAASKTTTTAKKTYSFSLDEAINYGVKNNTDILKLKLSLDQMDMSVSSLKKARKTAVEIYDTWFDRSDFPEGEVGDKLYATTMAELQAAQATMKNFDSYLLRNKFTEKQLENQQKVLKKTETMTTELTKLLITNAYYDVLMKKIAADDAVRNYDVVHSQTEAGRVKLKYGTISDMQLKTLEVSEKGAEISKIQAATDYDNSVMNLNELLGLPLDAALTLTTKLSVKTTSITENSSKKKSLKDNDITFYAAQIAWNESQEKLKYAKAYYGTSATEYKTLVKQNEIDKYTYQNAENTVDKKILTTYNNLTVMQKTVKLMQDKADLMKLALGIANVRKNYGTATENDVITASISYNQALNEYNQMVLNYNMLATLFEKNIMA
ncbi:MAG: TolC family protein [Clostridia bacterium]|nr:TolC family protein [Clostridia bacterium]